MTSPARSDADQPEALLGLPGACLPACELCAEEGGRSSAAKFVDETDRLVCDRHQGQALHGLDDEPDWSQLSDRDRDRFERESWPPPRE